jgi:putative endonuclease
MKMYFTYVLRSRKDNKLYIGFTENLRARISQHNNGKTRSTVGRQPLSLIYYEACLNEIDAINREKYLKTGYGRRYLNNRLANYKMDI